MKLPHRRQFLHLAGGAATLAAVSRNAGAQTYPTKPVRLIVPFPPGGPTDIGARLIGQALSERLGQQIVIENRAGAGGNIGTEAAVKSPPDGYTLLQVSTATAINNSLYEKLNFDIVRDIVPVASIYRQPAVLEVHPAFPAATVPEFIAYVKANPRKVNMASGGIGTPQHLTGELFKRIAGVEMIHVPYRGSAPALTDMIGGQVQVMFDTLNSSIEHIRSGRLRALAVTTATPSPILPDVPTVADFLPGFEVSSWSGVGAPRNTPAEIIDSLNREINAVLADPKINARLTDMGTTPFMGSPADFGKFIVDDADKWAKVIHSAGIKAE
jgi:tripartite-type tricarboxylate transporter receptor subunit TctC